MAHMKPEDWERYRQVMNEWQEDAFQQEVTWKRYLVNLDKHGEGGNSRYKDVIIKGLFQNSYFRSWPATKINDSGEIDKESTLLYLNIKYLQDNGWANEKGQMLFDPGYDRFVVNGLTYKSMGESQAAQAHDKPLFIFIILKREELLTGETKYAGQ